MYNWDDLLNASEEEILKELMTLRKRAKYLRIAVANNDDIQKVCKALTNVPAELKSTFKFCINIMNWSFTQNNSNVLVEI